MNEIKKEPKYWINSDGEYSFPKEYGELQLETVSKKLQLKAFNLPDFVIDDISTDNLLKMILSYPLQCDFYAFSSKREGLEVLSNEFNAVSELRRRKDMIDVALEYLMNMEIPQRAYFSMPDLEYENEEELFCYILSNPDMVKAAKLDTSVRFSVDFLEMIISDSLVMVNNDIKELVLDCTKKIMHEKNSSELFDEHELDPLLQRIIQLRMTPDAFAYARIADGIRSIIILYTPSGIPVSAQYNNSGVMNTSTSITLASQHNASIVSSATTDWNCHSFSWLQDIYPASTYIHVWLSNPSPFANDPAFQLISSPVVDAIVSYTGHSARVLILNSYNPAKQIPEPKFWSKWGPNYIFVHFPDNCPYQYTTFNYHKYYGT